MSKDAQIPPVALPDDAESLKQMLLEMTRQHDQRIAEIERQRDERIAELERQRSALELEKLVLQHRLDQALRRYYGPRADRIDPAQLTLEFAQELEKRPVDPESLLPQEIPGAGAAETPSVDPVSARRIKRRGRRDLSSFNHLPLTRKVHDLADDQKACPCCGTQRTRMGEESQWQIEYVPASFNRIEHVRVKYACRMCELKGENPRIVTAEKPAANQGGPGGVDKGMAGPGLLAYVVTSKFADYLPLYRMQNIFERIGLELDRSTLSVWCRDVADLIEPVYKRMVQRVLESHVIATDDTTMPMLMHGPRPGPGNQNAETTEESSGKTPVPGAIPGAGGNPWAGRTRTARVWVYVGDPGHPYNVFDFTISRTRDGPAKFLDGFKGTLLADAYGGYEGVCVEKSITQAGCWAHSRRKFVDAQSLEPAITGEALQLIGKLFDIEARARDLSDADRLAVRQSQSRPVLDTLHARLLSWQTRLLPKHPVAQAVGYALNQWRPLNVFVADGAVALDNNTAEREMKRQALNRKASLFVGNQRGGRTAAILSSITSTCRRHGIDPQRYITQLLVNLPTTPVSQLDQWLPDQWKTTQAQLPPLG